MKSNEESRARLRLLLTIAIVSLGVYLGFKYILPLILPFLFAYFLAFIIRPVTEFLFKKMKIPRIIGSSAILLVLTAVVGIGLCFLMNKLIIEAIGFIKNIPIYLNLMAEKLDHTCRYCDELLGLTMGTVRGAVDDHMVQVVERVRTNILPGISRQTFTFLVRFIMATGVILIVLIAAILIAKDLPDFRKRYENNSVYRDIHKVTSKLSDAGIAYLRTQLIIMIITAFFCVLGLTIMKNSYALLIGITIAIMDALPVLGSGLILIPWGIIMLIDGDIFAAAILITTFLICQVIREILEPKLIGKRIGVKPLYTLIAMYAGVKLFGFAGFILGPIGLIIIITVIKVLNDKKAEEAGRNTSYDED